MEYASFHYLMHKVPEHQKPFYVSGPQPLSFDELYSPRDKRLLVLKKEVSYWRTRDRIEYNIYEDRSHKVLIITCFNIEKKEAFRTIFVDLERLYFEIESKARDSRELLTIKSNKKLGDDAVLFKSVGDYVLARLNIKADPLPWPSFALTEQRPNNEPMSITIAQTTTIETTTAPVVLTSSTSTVSTTTPTPASISTPISETTDDNSNIMQQPVCPVERQCTLDKLSSDVYTSLEVDKPTSVTFLLDDIPNVKVQPSITAPIIEHATTTATTAAAAVPVPVVAQTSINNEDQTKPINNNTVKPKAPAAKGIKSLKKVAPSN